MECEVDNQAAQLGVSVFNVGALVRCLLLALKLVPDDSRDAIEIRARFH